MPPSSRVGDLPTPVAVSTADAGLRGAPLRPPPPAAAVVRPSLLQWIRDALVGDTKATTPPARSDDEATTAVTAPEVRKSPGSPDTDSAQLAVELLPGFMTPPPLPIFVVPPGQLPTLTPASTPTAAGTAAAADALTVTVVAASVATAAQVVGPSLAAPTTSTNAGPMSNPIAAVSARPLSQQVAAAPPVATTRAATGTAAPSTKISPAAADVPVVTAAVTVQDATIAVVSRTAELDPAGTGAFVAVFAHQPSSVATATAEAAVLPPSTPVSSAAPRAATDRIAARVLAPETRTPVASGTPPVMAAAVRSGTSTAPPDPAAVVNVEELVAAHRGAGVSIASTSPVVLPVPGELAVSSRAAVVAPQAVTGGATGPTVPIRGPELTAAVVTAPTASRVPVTRRDRVTPTAPAAPTIQSSAGPGMAARPVATTVPGGTTGAVALAETSSMLAPTLPSASPVPTGTVRARESVAAPTPDVPTRTQVSDAQVAPSPEKLKPTLQSGISARLAAAPVRYAATSRVAPPVHTLTTHTDLVAESATRLMTVPVSPSGSDVRTAIAGPASGGPPVTELGVTTDRPRSAPPSSESEAPPERASGAVPVPAAVAWVSPVSAPQSALEMSTAGWTSTPVVASVGTPPLSPDAIIDSVAQPSNTSPSFSASQGGAAPQSIPVVPATTVGQVWHARDGVIVTRAAGAEPEVPTAPMTRSALAASASLVPAPDPLTTRVDPISAPAAQPFPPAIEAPLASTTAPSLTSLPSLSTSTSAVEPLLPTSNGTPSRSTGQVTPSAAPSPATTVSDAGRRRSPSGVSLPQATLVVTDGAQPAGPARPDASSATPRVTSAHPVVPRPPASASASDAARPMSTTATLDVSAASAVPLALSSTAAPAGVDVLPFVAGPPVAPRTVSPPSQPPVMASTTSGAPWSVSTTTTPDVSTGSSVPSAPSSTIAPTAHDVPQAVVSSPIVALATPAPSVWAGPDAILPLLTAGPVAAAWSVAEPTSSVLPPRALTSGRPVSGVATAPFELDRPIRGELPADESEYADPVTSARRLPASSTRPPTAWESPSQVAAALRDAMNGSATSSATGRSASAGAPVASQLAEPMAAAVSRAFVHGATTTDVQVVLQPEGLGRVHVAAKLVDGRVHVEIACDSGAGAQAVRATLDGLREHLGDVTGAVTQLVVVHRPPDPGAPAVPPSSSASASAASGHGGGSSSSSTPHHHPPDGGVPPPVARAAPAAHDRTVARRGGDDLDLLI